MIFSPNITLQCFFDDAYKLHERRVDGGDVVGIWRAYEGFGGAAVVLIARIRGVIWILSENKTIVKNKSERFGQSISRYFVFGNFLNE